MVPLSGRGKVFIPAPDRCDVTADTSWRERELKEHDLLRPSRLGDREGGEREWARERTRVSSGTHDIPVRGRAGEGV